jgi:hypothetical protein
MKIVGQKKIILRWPRITNFDKRLTVIVAHDQPPKIRAFRIRLSHCRKPSPHPFGIGIEGFYHQIPDSFDILH